MFTCPCQFNKLHMTPDACKWITNMSSFKIIKFQGHKLINNVLWVSFMSQADVMFISRQEENYPTIT